MDLNQELPPEFNSLTVFVFDRCIKYVVDSIDAEVIARSLGAVQFFN